MTAATTLPGLRFEVTRPRAAPALLRSDIAGFIGRTRRGPIGVPVRVEEWRDYLRVFGGLLRNASLPYAIRGYFDNGGEIAHVVRVDGDMLATHSMPWNINKFDPNIESGLRAAGAFRFDHYTIEASSPGDWALGMKVSIEYLLHGPGGDPVVNITVRQEGEPVEHLVGLRPDVIEEGDTLEDRVAQASNLIRVKRTDHAKPRVMPAKQTGPNRAAWEIQFGQAPPQTFGAGAFEQPSAASYYSALSRLGDEPEVAILAMPALWEEIRERQLRLDIIQAASEQAAQLQDRMVVLDAPTQNERVVRHREQFGITAPAENDTVDKWVDSVESKLEIDAVRRCVAMYHPWLWVDDPEGAPQEPQRPVAPSGHVAGVISQLDRLRGPHHTPANVAVSDAFDLTCTFNKPEGARLYEKGVNLLVCKPSRGIMVWGGRTLDANEGCFVAHRRFVHRLVRAIRRVAEPIVFEKNGPELRLMLVRAVTTVLLGAFRAGALQGARPDEAFFVKCDENNNSPELVDLGRVICEIGLALAVPMEFITIRIALGESGELEVFDS